MDMHADLCINGTMVHLEGAFDAMWSKSVREYAGKSRGYNDSCSCLSFYTGLR